MVLDAPTLEKPPRRVLIIDTAWLGDVIFTTSLIGATRRAWPGSEIHVLVATRGELLLKAHPQIDRLWVYDKGGRERRLGSLMRIAEHLRRTEFDMVLNAHPSFRSRLLTWLTRAPVRVGYHGFLSSLMFTHRVSNSLHVEPNHAARRVALLRQLVPDADGVRLEVGVSDETGASVSRELHDRGIAESPILALIPGSARNTKMWPTERFAEIAARWIAEREGHVLVFGAGREQAVVEEIVGEAGGRAHGFVNRPLDLVAGLLSRCDCVVGNDTGVSFLAIAAGAKRVLVIYGCTQVNYHFPGPHRAVEAGVPCCLPRTGHGQSRCRWADRPWCMEQLGVDRVWEEIAGS